MVLSPQRKSFFRRHAPTFKYLLVFPGNQLTATVLFSVTTEQRSESFLWIFHLCLLVSPLRTVLTLFEPR